MRMNLRQVFRMRELEEVRQCAIEERFIERIRSTIRGWKLNTDFSIEEKMAE